MHASGIIQDLLARQCPQIHAKRRAGLAALAMASHSGGLSLVGMSRALPCTTSLRHRIKRCDRLLGNTSLAAQRELIYAAMCERLLARIERPAIIIDWSDLLPDCSQHLLRAALVVKGRALVLYEEIHPTAHYTSPTVHRRFLLRLRAMLPQQCRPVLITDAGFRAAWFKLLDELHFDWIGRIRNRDMVRQADAPDSPWCGCKSLYPQARRQARDLGHFDYVRRNPVRCRLVLLKRAPQGRHSLTLRGAPRRSKQSLAARASQTEPWLLAVSPPLASLPAAAVARLYAARMQIEQTFRDLKDARWGLGLRRAQTRKAERLTMLLLIAALSTYALWLIGLAARANGFDVPYASNRTATNTLSLLSLARVWIHEPGTVSLSMQSIRAAWDELLQLAKNLQI